MPVLDKYGKNLELKGRIPPVRFIHDISFYLDDINRYFYSYKATFARFTHQMLIPIGNYNNKMNIRDLDKDFLAELDEGIKMNISILKKETRRWSSSSFGKLSLNSYGIPILY